MRWRGERQSDQVEDRRGMTPVRGGMAIGDDRTQRQAAGTVRPESWTHGSSEMRARWLRRGLSTGDPDRCDTFQADRL